MFKALAIEVKEALTKAICDIYFIQ